MSTAPPRSTAPLATWQRLDWRFLLPGAVPEPIVHLGRDPDHRAALQALSEDLRVAGSAGQLTAMAGSAGTVVLSDPTPEDLAAAVAACRPGGWIVAEVRRRPTLRGPRTLLGWRRAFEHAGLDGVRASWHIRTVARATRIVPLDSVGVLRQVLAGHTGSPAGRARAAAARVLLGLGLIPVLAPEGTVIGRRPDGPAPLHATVLERAVPASYAATEALLITPREPTSRHVVAFVRTERGSRADVVVKAPRRPADVDGVEREAAVLTRLAESGEGAVRVPAVLGLVRDAGVTAFVQTRVEGRPLTPGAVRDDLAGAVALGRAFIDRLPVTAAAGEQPDWYERLVAAPLERLVAVAPLDGRTRRLTERTHAALADLRTAPMPLVLEHGDLAFPNLLVTGERDAGLGVIDWERAAVHGLPGHDLVFFAQFVAEAQRRIGYPRFDPAAVRGAFDDAFGSAEAWAVPLLREQLVRAGVDPERWRAMATISWARSAATLADRLAPDPDGAPLDAAGPIASARELLLWQHTLEADGTTR